MNEKRMDNFWDRNNYLSKCQFFDIFVRKFGMLQRITLLLYRKRECKWGGALENQGFYLNNCKRYKSFKSIEIFEPELGHFESNPYRVSISIFLIHFLA